MVRIEHDLGGHVDAFLALEAEASAPYAAFVHGDPVRARAVARALWDAGHAEFAPPGTLLALEGDALVGMLAWTPGRTLRRRRLSAALALSRPGAAAFTDEERRRVAIAGETLLRVRDDDAYLSRVAVAPAARGRGVAARLVAEYLAAAAAAGMARCVLEVEGANLAAQALYARAGFVELERRVSRDDARGATISYVHMSRPALP